MSVVCFSLVKNEEDIVEAFVRHTLKQVDHLYLQDNLSTDGTRDILDSLMAEGLPLTVVDDPEQALIQNEKMTAMYRHYAKRSDFCFAFFLDVDEFLHLDKDLMYRVREKTGCGKAYYVPRTNYLYSDETPVGDALSVFSTMTTTDNHPEDPKSMIFHGEDECRRFRIGNGNHHVRDWARGGEIVSEEQPDEFATIFHFPVRSVDQYVRKHLLGWLALMLREPGVNEADQTIGAHWRAQFRLIMAQDGRVTAAQVKDNLYNGDYAGRRGAEQPLTVDFELRYSHLIRRQSVLVQAIEMYSRTIDQLWAERQRTSSAKRHLPLSPSADSSSSTVSS